MMKVLKKVSVLPLILHSSVGGLRLSAVSLYFSANRDLLLSYGKSVKEVSSECAAS